MNTETVAALAPAIVPKGFGKLFAAVLKGVGRAILVVLVVAIAILTGLAVPVVLREWIAAVPPAGLAFGAAAILGVAKGLFESLPTAWNFIVRGAAETLPKIFAEIAVATLGLGFAYFAAATNSDPGRSLNLNVGGSLPPVIMSESDSLLTAYVVFDEWKSELNPGDSQIGLVNNLVDSLATCIQAPTDSVDLRVRAYASSFGSDATNEKLYKDRGAYVASLLRAHLELHSPASQKQFHIEVQDWKSLGLMKIRRMFKDTDDSGAYLKSAGALNRRAEIKVRSAGSCLPT